jgi:hypothetical protein
MNTFADPFKYSDADSDWFDELKRQKRRAYRAKKLGREIGTWGGRRPGTGRPPTLKKEEIPFNLKLNSIQKMNLLELGEGNLEKGIQALIEKYL